MIPIIIPKKLAKEDLVLIPRREYEGLLKLKKTEEFVPTSAQKKALAKAEKNLKLGKTLSYNAFTRKLGLTS